MMMHFIDSHGTDWMVIRGLPAGHPAADAGAGPGMSLGFTFRAGTGELRVLPLAELRRTAAPPPNVAPWRVVPRPHHAKAADWQALLEQARPWP
jgi:hypothetical protein